MNQRRSERISLQIRLIVETNLHGGYQVYLDAFTLAVSAHGGLLEMGLKVSRGQALILISPISRSRQSCTVVESKHLRDGMFAVAFEFATPAPQFWPISFPPVSWELVRS